MSHSTHGQRQTKQTKNLCGNNALCWWNPRTRQPYLGAVSVARPAFGPWKTSSYPLHSSILLHFLFDAVKAMAYEPIPLFWFKRERECECGVRACARMRYVVRVLCMLSECVDGRASVSNARMNVKTIEFQLNQLWDAHKHTRQKRKTSLRIVCVHVFGTISLWVCGARPSVRVTPTREMMQKRKNQNKLSKQMKCEQEKAATTAPAAWQTQHDDDLLAQICTYIFFFRSIFFFIWFRPAVHANAMYRNDLLVSYTTIWPQPKRWIHVTTIYWILQNHSDICVCPKCTVQKSIDTHSHSRSGHGP